MSFRHHRVVVAVVAGALLVGAAGLAAAAPGPSGSGASPAALSPAADPEGFVGVSPVRVLDTRAGDGPIGVPSAAPLGPGQEITLPLTTTAPNRATAPVPTNAVSVLLNITIDKNATADSFITVWPTGQPRPNSSANNATPGLVTPNSIVVPLGPDGSVSIFNFTGNVELAVDLAGYTVPLAGSSIQGPPGPPGPPGPKGDQGERGPMGPITGAGWLSSPEVATTTIGETATLVTSVGPTATSGNFIVTASFRVATVSPSTNVTCEVRDQATLAGAVAATMLKPENVTAGIDDGMTLTAVIVGKTGASLDCFKAGTGAAVATVTVTDARLVAVAVGDQL